MTRGSADTLLSVQKAMSVLLMFSKDCPELSVSELSRRMGIPKSGAHRLLHSLTESGFLEQDSDSRRFRLGLRLFALGRLLEQPSRLVTEALPAMRSLGRDTDETVHLGVYDRGHVLYLERLEGRFHLPMPSSIGARLPVHASAIGKALLSRQSAAEIRAVMASELPVFTANTIRTGPELQAALDQVRARGYAQDLEEIHPALSCVAAPIVTSDGETVGAISVAGRSARVTRILSWLPGRVIRAAQEIAAAVEANAPDLRSARRANRFG